MHINNKHRNTSYHQFLTNVVLKGAEIFENRSNINEKYNYVDIDARIIYIFHYFLYRMLLCDDLGQPKHNTYS